MAKTVSIEMIHEDLEILKKDMAELKALFLEPKLKKEIVDKVRQARKRIAAVYVSNEDIKKEFGV
ncbi:hypothetical protein HY992_00570 [Candidatus Micrarchaeota archaeon]|nr:hypothetical protein [Candidatus Micrarchaeota archaeon]